MTNLAPVSTFLALAAGVLLSAGVVVAEDEPPPRLVVLLVVDGLGPAVVDRVDDLFVGGLRRLYTEGVVLTDCHQDHAYTWTGPGHFVLASGQFPGPAGIIANAFYDPAAGKKIYCIGDSLATNVGDTERACSYRAVNGSTVGDWMKTRWPEAKVFSISGKDRAAVLMGGRSADGVYWFSQRSGDFVTSTYYETDRPDWLDDFNARDLPGAFAAMPWERVIADTTLYRERARADRYPGESDFSSACAENPRNDPVFDHHLACNPTRDRPSFARLFYRLPFVDSVLLDLATEIVSAERLGEDEAPDLLCIGLSGLDGVVHYTGPFSQESIDTVLRLDREIGAFMEWLDAEIGMGTYTLLLSSDHGSPPLPEYGPVVGIATRRVHAEAEAFVERVKAELRYVTDGPVVRYADAEGFFLDPAVLRRSGLTESDVVETIRTLAAGEDWIAWVKGRAELLAMDADEPSLDATVRRHLNHLHPSRTPQVVVCPAPGVILSSYDRGTTHGSTYDYDTHVPAVFYGAGVAEGEIIDRFVRTADLAPTLAEAMGLTPPPSVDGRSVSEVVSPTR